MILRLKCNPDFKAMHRDSYAHALVKNRYGLDVYIDKNVLFALGTDAFKKTGASIFWPGAKAYNLTKNYVYNAVIGALDKLGLRYRIKIEPRPGMDGFEVVKQEGLRQLPRAYRTRPDGTVGSPRNAEEAMHALMLKEQAAIDAGQPLDYGRRGRSLATTTKYKWEDLEVGAMAVHNAPISDLQGSFKSWAKARDMRGAKIRCKTALDGSVTVHRVK